MRIIIFIFDSGEKNKESESNHSLGQEGERIAHKAKTFPIPISRRRRY